MPTMNKVDLLDCAAGHHNFDDAEECSVCGHTVEPVTPADMPKFTIECTYDLPVYRHTTYEADTVEAAIALALADQDWEKQKKDYDSSGDTRVTGIWEGEDAAYMGKAVEFPDDPATLLRDTAPDLLAALKEALEVMGEWGGRRRPRMVRPRPNSHRQIRGPGDLTRPDTAPPRNHAKKEETMTETTSQKFRERDSYTTLQMEAALCAWEWMCENRDHAMLKKYFDDMGSAAMRHCSMQAGDIALRVHDHMSSRGYGYADAYDWEFVPGVLLRLDWHALTSDNQFGGANYDPDVDAIFVAMVAADKARNTEPDRRSFYVEKPVFNDWEAKARAAADRLWRYADLIVDHEEKAMAAYTNGEDPAEFAKWLGEKYGLTPAAEWGDYA